MAAPADGGECRDRFSGQEFGDEQVAQAGLFHQPPEAHLVVVADHDQGARRDLPQVGLGKRGLRNAEDPPERVGGGRQGAGIDPGATGVKQQALRGPTR